MGDVHRPVRGDVDEVLYLIGLDVAEVPEVDRQHHAGQHRFVDVWPQVWWLAADQADAVPHCPSVVVKADALVLGPGHRCEIGGEDTGADLVHDCVVYLRDPGEPITLLRAGAPDDCVARRR